VPVELAAGITSAAMSQAAASSVRFAPSILKLMVVKKLSLAAIGVIALSLAAVLVARNAPDSNPQSGAANLPKANQASPVELGGPARYPAPRGDPDIVKKMAQRQAEQARAREAQIAAERRAEWDKKVANFDDSLKEEPGVKKFGAKIQAAFGPGQTLVASAKRLGVRDATNESGAGRCRCEFEYRLDSARADRRARRSFGSSGNGDFQSASTAGQPERAGDVVQPTSRCHVQQHHKRNRQ
jgi:hypothetical protein